MNNILLPRISYKLSFEEIKDLLTRITETVTTAGSLW